MVERAHQEDLFSCVVAGTSFRQPAVRQAQPGDPIRLELDRDNQYDSNAVKVVHRDDPALWYGFVPRDSNQALAEALRSGCTAAGRVRSTAPAGPEQTVGMIIEFELDYSAAVVK